MKKGHRVDIIKKNADKLSELNYGDIDLILRQFGFPWSEQWTGTKKEYCQHYVEQGSDDDLLELYEHLYGGNPYVFGERTPTSQVWKNGYFRLFISHISSDKEAVSKVKGYLLNYGIDAFVAHQDIEPTKEWVTEIEIALDNCDALTAFLTSNYHKSLWTDQEVGYCIKRRILIIPIRLGIDPYGFMGKYQALTPTSKMADQIAKDIFKILLTHDLTADRMAPCVVRLFENSDSFSESKRISGYLKKLKHWSPELLGRIEDAVKKNSQIKDSWGVPEQVKEIVSKYGR